MSLLVIAEGAHGLGLCILSGCRLINEPRILRAQSSRSPTLDEVGHLASPEGDKAFIEFS